MSYKDDFYNIVHNGGHAAIWNDITIENSLTTTLRSFYLRPISREVTITFGTANSAATITNNDAFSFLSNTVNSPSNRSSGTIISATFSFS